jgi:NADPH:quinone reductase
MKPSSKMHALIVDDYQMATFRTAEIPRPEPIANQVLVRIKASGVNPLDSKIRIGKAPHAKPVLPAVLGTDLAGIVEAVGSEVTAFQVGDERQTLMTQYNVQNPGHLGYLAVGD